MVGNNSGKYLPYKSAVQRIFLSIFILILFSAGTVQGYASDAFAQTKIAINLQQKLSWMQPDEMVTVLVRLKGKANVAGIQAADRKQRLSSVVVSLKSRADNDQKKIRQLLNVWQAKGLVSDVKYLWIINGIQLTASPEVIKELAAQPEVQVIQPDEVISTPPIFETASTPEKNLIQISAPALWELGYRGQGIVVANMDTGVFLEHPDLQAQWRGGTNSWFDPYGEHPDSPVDNNGHGTSTMGVMVGKDTGGTAIGVAPEAKWIAVRIFNDQQQATVLGIHQAFQWLLDPDGNPSTADAPHVINSSWLLTATGCNLEFQEDLQAMRAAGILPIFSAGNHGPDPDSGRSPANYPEAFSVGAVASDDLVAVFSSRGPTNCDSESRIYPNLVAPGVSVSTTNISGSYSLSSGTSFAAPHVAGGLALLLSAFPDLTVAQQEASLLASVVDLGIVGSDNDYGDGRLDIMEAYRWLVVNVPDSPGNPQPPSDPLGSFFVFLPVLTK